MGTPWSRLPESNLPCHYETDLARMLALVRPVVEREVRFTQSLQVALSRPTGNISGTPAVQAEPVVRCPMNSPQSGRGSAKCGSQLMRVASFAPTSSMLISHRYR